MMATIMGVLEASSVQISFVDNEIIEAKDKVLEYLKDPKLEKYTYKINSLLSYKYGINDVAISPAPQIIIF